MKAKRIVRLILETLLTIFIITLSVMTVSASYTNSKVEKLVDDFISSAHFEFEGNNYLYYKVDGNMENTISINYNESINFYDAPTLGAYGDIFAIPESNVDVFPFSKDFISYYFGGHAGIILKDKKILETSGMNEESCNKVSIETNNLLSEERMVIGLRVKEDEDKINEAVEYALSLEGKKYNNSFIFARKNRYYCTDLVSRSYEKAGIKLDKTMIYTTVDELILSEYTDISFIMLKKNNKTYIYYVG